MKHNNPYQIIKQRYITEKASMLQGLKDAESNASLRRCEKWWLRRVRIFELDKRKRGLPLTKGFPPAERYTALLGAMR